MKKSHYVVILMLLIIAAAFVIPVIDPSLIEVFNWGVLSAVLAVLICLALFFEFESAATSSKEIALIAMLGTISAVVRLPFAAVPSVQPSTYIIICAGFVFGPVAGFAVGAITPLVSNFFLGHGPWTLYQMIAWGLVGLTAGYLGRFRLNRPVLVVFGVVWGYLYGFITNIWFWLSFVYPLTWQSLIVTQANTVWFDTLHAVANVVFLAVLGVKTVEVLQRFRQRFNVFYLSRESGKDRLTDTPPESAG